MVAVAVLDDVHVAVAVRFCVVPSVSVPVAVNCCVSPLATLGLPGVTAMEASTAGVTVSVVFPDTVPEVAEIVVVPTATVVARPPAAMVAVAVLDDVQVTEVVRFCVELSVYVPVAVNCGAIPLATLGLAGVTAMETSAAPVTVSVVFPVMLPEVAEIVVVPAATVVARPPAAIVAVVVLDDAQVAVAVRSCVEPSVSVPVAVNCCVSPLATLAFAGVTAMETSAAGITVSVVFPDTVPEVAEIVVVPVARVVARPPAAMVAVVGVDDAQVAVDVRSCVEASVYVPVAVNCCLRPLATLGVAGVTAMETSAAALTVSVVFPDTVPELAEIVVVPVARVVARPLAAMVAVVGVDDAQVAVAVRFCVEPSVYVPVAVNCCVSPLATLGLPGVTAIETSAAAVTVNVVLPVMLPEVAEIVVVPAATPVARPVEAIVAAATLLDAQVAVEVRFCVEPSVYVPVAVNGCVSPLATLGLAGVTAMETSAAAVTVSVVLPLKLPEVAEIVVVPAATPVARPPAAMVAAAVLDDAQVAVEVRFCVEPSVYVPVAVNGCVSPLATLGLAGVTAMETSAGVSTVSPVLPVTPPDVAEIVDVPTATVVARPPAAIVAAFTLVDAQVAEAVRSSVEPSVYVPMAVNCCVSPAATTGFAGVTAMETSAAGVTVSVVLPVMLPEVAEMVGVPAAWVVARPPAAIVAAAVLDDAQVAVAVRFCVVPSVYVPVAVNCSVNPADTLWFAGVTAMETSAAGVTVSAVLPVMLPEVAEIVVVPAATAVARPLAAMVAVAVLDDAQVAVEVRFCVEPSVYVPVAVNCCVSPFAMLGFAGVTAMETSAAAFTVSVVLPVMLPEVAEIVVVPAATAVARPPAAIVAVVVLDDAQVAVAVRFCVEPSVYVPVAANCCVSPLETLGLAGVTAIETSAAGSTVSVVLPVMLPEVAEIVVVPAATVVARPPAAMVAAAVLDDAQVAVVVRSSVEPSV
jgi:hypothetical protein